MNLESTENLESIVSSDRTDDAGSRPEPNQKEEPNQEGRISRRTLAVGGAGALATADLASSSPAFAKPAAEIDSEVADAVIVGAGFSGSLIAGVLARAGKRVVVLESGPERHTRDLVSSKIWARSLHGPYAVMPQGANPIAFGFEVGWGLGGSGTHHFAVWPRLHQLDFELKTRYGRGFNWPIDYDELRPYYDRVQRDIGVSGDSVSSRTDTSPAEIRRACSAADLRRSGCAQRRPRPLSFRARTRAGPPASTSDGARPDARSARLVIRWSR